MENASLIPTATINPQALYGGNGAHSGLKADGFKLLRVFPGVQGWQPDYAAFTTLVKSLSEDSIPVMVDLDGPGTASRLVNAIAGNSAPIILSGVDERTLAEALSLKREHANVYIETAGLLSAGALKFVVDSVGPDRVLFGSGAPARPMAGVLGVLKHSGLGETESTAVLSGNAKRLLGL